MVVAEEGSVGGGREDVYGKYEVGFVESAVVEEAFDYGWEGFGCVVDCV
jgi:hypothetical protein